MTSLITLNSDKIYTIQEIETWFNENWKDYNFIADRWNCKYCPTKKSLPCICVEPDEKYKFLKLYEAVDEILRFHRKEEYFKVEMLEYNEVKASQTNLKIWASKNEKLGTDVFSNFKSKYLSWDIENYENSSLRVYGCTDLELVIINNIREQIGKVDKKTKLDFDIYINREDFKNIINFVEVFEKVFWEQEILPESIERIYNEMD